MIGLIRPKVAEADRPGICSTRNPIRKNLGTFGFISPKVAFLVFYVFSNIESIESIEPIDQSANRPIDRIDRRPPCLRRRGLLGHELARRRARISLAVYDVEAHSIISRAV